MCRLFRRTHRLTNHGRNSGIGNQNETNSHKPLPNCRPSDQHLQKRRGGQEQESVLWQISQPFIECVMAMEIPNFTPRGSPAEGITIRLVISVRPSGRLAIIAAAPLGHFPPQCPKSKRSGSVGTSRGASVGVASSGNMGGGAGSSSNCGTTSVKDSATIAPPV